MRPWLVFLFLILSCSSNDNAVLSDLGTPAKLMAACADSSCSYFYTITKSSSYTLQTKAGKEEMSNQVTFYVRQQFSVDSNRNLMLTTTYSRIDIDEDRNGEKTSSSITPDMITTDPDLLIWSYIIRSKPILKWDSSGKFTGQHGLEYLADSVISRTDTDPATKAQLRKKWDETMTEAQQYFSANLIPEFLSGHSIMEDKPFKRSEQARAMEIPVNLEVEYLLNDLDGKRAYFTSRSDISIKNPISSLLPATDLSLSGKQEGQYTIDRSTGLTEQSKLQTRLKGIMNFGGQEIPVSIVNALSIQRK